MINGQKFIFTKIEPHSGFYPYYCFNARNKKPFPSRRPHIDFATFKIGDKVKMLFATTPEEFEKKHETYRQYISNTSTLTGIILKQKRYMDTIKHEYGIEITHDGFRMLWFYLCIMSTLCLNYGILEIKKGALGP